MGVPFYLDGQVPEIEWTAYGKQSEYWLVGSNNEAHLVKEGAVVRSCVIRFGRYSQYLSEVMPKYIIEIEERFKNEDHKVLVFPSTGSPIGIIDYDGDIKVFSLNTDNEKKVVTVTLDKTCSVNDQISYEDVLNQIQ